MIPITFVYKAGDVTGVCKGASFAQAVDRARVDWVRKTTGYEPTDPRFRLAKSKANSVTFKLGLSQPSLEHYVKLYRQFQQGELSEEGRDQLDQFQKIIKDKDQYNGSKETAPSR